MTNEQLILVNDLKQKVSDLNGVIKKINEDDENPIRVIIKQKEWGAMTHAPAVVNSVKYIECSVSETFSY